MMKSIISGFIKVTACEAHRPLETETHETLINLNHIESIKPYEYSEDFGSYITTDNTSYRVKESFEEVENIIARSLSYMRSPTCGSSFDGKLDEASRLILEEAKHYKPSSAIKEFVDKINSGELPPLSLDDTFGIQKEE